MKIQRIVSILFLICFCAAAYSQDIIITKDSRRIKADIIEVSPTSVSYKIYGKPDSPIITIAVENVKSILYESDLEPGDDTDDETPLPKKSRKYIQKPTINAFIENSFSFYPSHSLKSIDPSRVILGVQLNDYFFIGAGAAIKYFPNNTYKSRHEMVDTMFLLYYDEVPQFVLTPFLSSRLTFRVKEQIASFAEIEFGYSMCRREWTRDYFGSPFCSAGIGMVVWHFEISAGYEFLVLPLDRMYKLEYWSDFDQLNQSKGQLNMGNIYIKIGANIGHVTK